MLVEATKAGDMKAAAKLYQEHSGLIRIIARRYWWVDDPAVDMDDLMQVGFFGILEAAQRWKPELGAWSTVATWCITRAIREAYGIRRSKIPVHLKTLSLNAPLGEDGEQTRLNMLVSSNAHDVDAQLIQCDLQQRVREAARNHPEVWMHDLEGQTYQAISDKTGTAIHNVINARRRSMAKLARNMSLRRLLDEETRFYTHKGVCAFNTDWTSTTEAAALWRIEKRGIEG